MHLPSGSAPPGHPTPPTPASPRQLCSFPSPLGLSASSPSLRFSRTPAALPKALGTCPPPGPHPTASLWETGVALAGVTSAKRSSLLVRTTAVCATGASSAWTTTASGSRRALVPATTNGSSFSSSTPSSLAALPFRACASMGPSSARVLLTMACRTAHRLCIRLSPSRSLSALRSPSASPASLSCTPALSHATSPSLKHSTLRMSLAICLAEKTMDALATLRLCLDQLGGLGSCQFE